MELNLIKMSDKELELEITGEKQTLLNPLKERLLLDKNVDYAEWIVDHPMISKPRLYLKVHEENPLDILKKTIAELRKEAKYFRSVFNKSLKEKLS
jgi:DNA-directed RNA polymerase subunit L